jgi:hypothetical protein
MAPSRSTLERLVRLKMLLARAVASTSDLSATGRHNSLIELDGSCEYAMGLTSAELGLARPREFHKTFQAIREAMPGWRAEGWKGVEELHTQRNSAQHQGLLPDPAEYQRWAADAQAFVSSLVAAAFGVPLRDVRTADAVTNQSLRETLSDAEHVLDTSGPPKEAFDLVLSAFREARRLWAIEHKDAVPRPSAPMRMNDFTSADVRKAIEIAADFSEVSPFGDVAEYLWLRSLEGSPVPPTADEASRAFIFVLGWIVRWEAFSSTYATSLIRMMGHALKQQAPRTGTASGEPVIKVVSLDEERTPGMFSVSLQLYDLPEDWQARWIGEFNDALLPRLKALPFKVTTSRLGGDGGLWLSGVPGDRASLSQLVETIKGAIPEADAGYEAAQEDLRAWRAGVPALAAQYDPAVADLEMGGRKFCSDVMFMGRGEGVVKLLPDSDDATGRLTTALFQAFHSEPGTGIGQTGVEFSSVSGMVTFNPARVSPDQLRTRLIDVAAAVEKKEAADAADAKALEERTRAAEQDLIDLLRPR